MADDVQIADTSSGDAPHDYTVPSSADFILKAAYGVFDGTLASGNFLPAIEIVSDSGHTVARSVGQQVTAGDSAEVSWFPFAPPASSGGGGSGITEIVDDGGITVIDGTGPTVGIAVTTPLVGRQEQLAVAGQLINAGTGAELSWSYNAGATFLDLTTPTAPKITTTGLYAFSLYVNDIPGLLPPTDSLVEIQCDVAGTAMRGWLARPTTNTLMDEQTFAAITDVPAATSFSAVIGNQTSVNLTFQATLTVVWVA